MKNFLALLGSVGIASFVGAGLDLMTGDFFFFNGFGTYAGGVVIGWYIRGIWS